MNIHVVVEGECEKELYPYWVPLVNPALSYVDHISLIQNNNFSVISGRGYPQYFDVISAAIEDVNSYNIDRLVICVDSEDFSYEEKLDEIANHVSQFSCNVMIKIIIQHFCIESWALGNKVIVRPNPRSQSLIRYKKFYDVRSNDPELLPSYDMEELNRAQFAEKYLKHAVNDKYKQLTYNKRNPKALLNKKYYNRVKERFEQTEHIASFENFLSAFI